MTGKTLKFFEWAAFSVLILFAIFGMFILGNILHEYSHYSDYKDITKNDQICWLSAPANDSSVFNISNPLAYLKFDYNPNDEAKIEQIGKYTEIKAYSINAVLIAFFFLCLLIVFVSRINRADNEFHGEM